MRTDDQWFQPGDKVVRVMTREEVDTKMPHAPLKCVTTEMGRVYCVIDCWRGKHCNLMHLAGLEEHEFRAMAFRKVEEIKLCVRAAEKMRQPQEEQPA